MKTITLHNVPAELSRRLDEKARARGVSLSRVVIEILEKGMGLRKGEPRALHRDLDSLAGTWTEEEALAFEESLRDQRSIAAGPWR